jgi:hypothetical protein
MTPPFLDTLPREIRDLIYIQVLASSSGIVTLTPWTVEVAQSLSILRTCKQIHRECKDIIWRHNNLRPHTPSQLFLKFQQLEKFQRMRRFRHIQRIPHMSMHLDLLDRDELQWACQALIALAQWKPRRRFESITLIAVRDRPRNLSEFEGISKLRKDGELVDGRLYNQSLSFEMMAVNTTWPRFSHWGKQRWLREMLLDPGDPADILEEIHNAFGGELYIDEKLCYKDHCRVMDDLQLDPRGGEIKILPTTQGRADNSLGSTRWRK